MKANAISALLLCCMIGCDSRTRDSSTSTPEEDQRTQRDAPNEAFDDAGLTKMQLDRHLDRRLRLQEVIKLQEGFLEHWKAEQADAEARKNVGFLIDANRRVRNYESAINKAKADLRELDRRIENLKEHAESP